MSAAADILEPDTSPSRLFVTCEHASNHVPDSFELSETDRELLETHWGWDLGAEHFVRALVDREDAPAVVSRFSRLICDPNRGRHQENLFRTHALGRRISLNANLDREERERRFETFHEAYHQTIDRRLERAVEANPEIFLLSVHTFTPQLGTHKRDTEIGLLFDDYPEYIDGIADALRARGFETALNEPYSGWEGMIYSVERHAYTHDLRYLEIEIRNDLLETSEAVDEVAGAVSEVLDDTVLRWPDEE